jgi:hypothetical protein
VARPIPVEIPLMTVFRGIALAISNFQFLIFNFNQKACTWDHQPLAEGNLKEDDPYPGLP